MSSGSDNLRLFVAIPPCPGIIAVSELLMSKNQDLTGTRWIPARNLHVTIFFLGEVRAAFLNEIILKMEHVAKSTSVFEINLDGITLEGGRAGHPSMVWARFHRSEQFTALSGVLRESLTPFVTAPSKFTDPIPHITLARIRSGPAPQLDGDVSCKISIRALELWKTIRHDNGVIYEMLAKSTVPAD